MVLGRSRICAVALLAIASFTGCKPDAAVKDPAIVGRGTTDQPTPQLNPARDSGAPPTADSPTGAITGTIIFHGKVPAKTIDTSMDPACSPHGPAKLPVEQYVANNGKLANVFLYVKDGPPEAMSASSTVQQPAILDQVHCQYVPHVIGVMQGGYIEFRNSDASTNNVHTQPTDIRNETIDVSIGPHGIPQTKQFRRPELMIPVRCNNHPWMNAFINVSATPFFAVSDASGHFELRNLPVGTYTIGAVHEKMGEKTMQVTVTADHVSKAEFSFAGQ